MLGLLLRTVISIFSFISCVNRGKFYHGHKIRHTTLNTTLKRYKALILLYFSDVFSIQAQIFYCFLTLLDISHFSRSKPFVRLGLSHKIIGHGNTLKLYVCIKGCIRVVRLHERFTDKSTGNKRLKISSHGQGNHNYCLSYRS